MQQERLRALGQMSSGVAHDINNALSPITLYTESLLHNETGLSVRGRGFLEIIQRAVGDISHTVTRLGDFSRPSATDTDPTLVNLNALVPHVMALTQARWSDMAQQRGVAIDMRSDLYEDLPPVTGLASEIREALINLIFNAVDAMPDGGALTVTTRLAPNDPERRVLLEVTDTGIGMDDETKRRCLEPFFTTKGKRGSGLGLAMVYGFAHRHNAKVEINSAVGAGTTIGLNFPTALANVGALKSVDESAPNRRPLRLLLVDDDALLLTSLTDILQADGHSVTPTPDGPRGVAAFRLAQTEGKPFDAVITDLGMPHMNGRRVATAVKEESALTPVILLTGWGQNFTGELPKDIDCVLNKPPTLNDLRAALVQCCDGVKPAPGSRRASRS
jgi:CheY-like chemotaxis protein